jgi:hypothetical protein
MHLNITSDAYQRLEREKALKALEKAKTLEAKRIRSGFQYIKKDSRTIVLQRA